MKVQINAVNVFNIILIIANETIFGSHKKLRQFLYNNEVFIDRVATST